MLCLGRSSLLCQCALQSVKGRQILGGTSVRHILHYLCELTAQFIAVRGKVVVLGIASAHKTQGVFACRSEDADFRFDLAVAKELVGSRLHRVDAARLVGWIRPLAFPLVARLPALCRLGCIEFAKGFLVRNSRCNKIPDLLFGKCPCTFEFFLLLNLFVQILNCGTESAQHNFQIPQVIVDLVSDVIPVYRPDAPDTAWASDFLPQFTVVATNRNKTAGRISLRLRDGSISFSTCNKQRGDEVFGLQMSQVSKTCGRGLEELEN
mmetsp:Transcript_46373/g.91981  ORF Transcript_46373/g.91981 Transcript_46373/m.91981 type:complete len:265 (-) Transcript_46373:102-896(-)